MGLLCKLHWKCRDMLVSRVIRLGVGGNRAIIRASKGKVTIKGISSLNQPHHLKILLHLRDPSLEQMLSLKNP